MLSTCDCGSSDDTHTNVHWLIAVRPHYNLQMPLLVIVVLVTVPWVLAWVLLYHVAHVPRGTFSIFAMLYNPALASLHVDCVFYHST
jgi:hypothetical protein